MARHRIPRVRAVPPVLDGATIARQAVVKLYDKGDGQGVDWRLVANTLFKAAFEVLDRLPPDACRSVAARVHEGAYWRVSHGPKATPDADLGDEGIAFRDSHEPGNMPGGASATIPEAP